MLICVQSREEMYCVSLMITGGPVSVIWGWVVVCSMTMFIALSMAEIVSALPTSGGQY